MSAGALDGLRVLDLSRLLPGGFCSLLLADFGADVIKVEDTRMGDYIRWAPPFYAGAERSAASAMFLSLNRGKRSIRVDLKLEQGREVLLRLARDADVVLESFRPGVMDRLGVGYETLREVNPGLVYCAITGYGQDGPLRDRAGHDMNYLGRVGLLGLTGEADGPPVQAAAQIADIGGGALTAAFGILAALRERDRTGEGQYVQSGLFENAAWLVSTHMMQHVVSGKEPEPMSAGKRAWGVYDIFDSSDGVRLFVGVVTERQWEIFTKALGEPELLDPAYATNNQRSLARAALIPLVARLLKKHPIAELERICEEGGLPFARIQTPSALFDDPHLNAGGMVPLSLPDGKKTQIPGLPVQFGTQRLALRSDLPTPGQHNAEILGDLK